MCCVTFGTVTGNLLGNGIGNVSNNLVFTIAQCTRRCKSFFNSLSIFVTIPQYYFIILCICHNYYSFYLKTQRRLLVKASNCMIMEMLRKSLKLRVVLLHGEQKLPLRVVPLWRSFTYPDSTPCQYHHHDTYIPPPQTPQPLRIHQVFSPIPPHVLSRRRSG